ncbi:MAG: DUF4097 family beta strand repeat-containing protein [Gemmatimonadota bacterium]
MTNAIEQNGTGARDIGRHSRRRRGEGRGKPARVPIFLSALVLIASPFVLAPVPLVAQEQIDERRPLARDGHLRIQAVNHAVRVEAWDQDEVHLTGTIDPLTQRLEVSGDERSVSIEIRHEGGESRNGPAGSLELRVPRGAMLSIGTVNGDLSIEGVEGGTVNVSTVNGAIRMDGSPATAALQTVNGPIEFEGSTDDLQLHLVSSDVQIRGAPRRVNVQSVSGRIDLQADEAMESIRVNTVAGEVVIAGALTSRSSVEVQSHGGPVILRLPAGTPAAYEVSTFSGSIQNRLTDDEPRTVPRSNTLRFVVGDGSAQVRLNSFSGSITLEPAR